MLELTSNKIKVLGIFGRLTPDSEAYFDKIEDEFSKKPASDDYDIFRHLTLTFIPNASVSDLKQQLDLLKSLKNFLPLKIDVSSATVKDEESLDGAQHIAFEFDLSQTKEIVDFIEQKVGGKSVATWYIKVVWFVPKENQKAVIEILADLETLEFSDFYLVSNKQDEANTIYTTTSFQS
jgi:hypothetical protein